MERPLTFRHQMIEQYDVRVNGEYAIICIDPRGILLVESSYGSFNYWWGAAGSDFKQFLTELNPDYFFGKVRQGQQDHYFDRDETEKRIKERILEERRNKDISKDFARECWNDLHEDIREFYGDDKGTCNLFVSDLMDTYSLSKLFDDYDSVPIVTGFPRECHHFWENVWCPFIEMLKDEIRCRNIKLSPLSEEEKQPIPE